METKQDDTVMVYAVSGAVSLFLVLVVIVLLVLFCKYRKADEVKKRLDLRQQAMHANPDVENNDEHNTHEALMCGKCGMEMKQDMIRMHDSDGVFLCATCKTFERDVVHRTDQSGPVPGDPVPMCGECGVKLRQDRDRKLSTDGVVICATCKTLERDVVHRNDQSGPAPGDPIRFSQKGELNGNDGTDSATFEQVEGGFKDNDDDSDDVGLGYTNEGSQAKSSSDSMEQIYVKEEIKALEVNKMQSIEPNVTKQGDTDSGKKEEKTKGDEYYDEYLQRIYEKSRKYAGK
eukprot:274007_1